MFQSYLKIALRHGVKRPFYSIVNVMGLAMGLTFTLLIASFVWGELQVNDRLKNADNQYIIRSKWKQPGLGYEEVTVAPLGKLLKEQYPGLVANYYRFDVLTTAVSNGDKHFVREVAQAGDCTMIGMYGFNMLYGNAQTALKNPNSVVITEENAIKYFGRTDVVGQVLSLSNYAGSKQDFVVTGVLKSLAKNSITYLWDMPVNVFIPFNSLQGRTDTDGWTTWNIATYIELQEGVQAEQLDGPIAKLIATYASKDVKENLRPYLTPLKKYYREFNNSIVKKTIYTLLSVAAFILLMAVVNFVNIAIANASSRVKEIGIRKSLGSLKRQLVYQFLAESILSAMLSMSISLVLYELFRSSFADVVGRIIEPFWAISPYFLGTVTLLTLLIGITAGIYPAFLLASLPSVDSLKGKLKSIKKGVLFRQLLITAQFSIALLVFCGAIVISQQVAYFFNKNSGFNKESILLVSLPRDWTPQGVANMETVRNELGRVAAVKSISISSSTLKSGTDYNINLYPVGKDSTQSTTTSVLQTDENFAETYQIPMVAGKFYGSSKPADHEDKIVLNETAIYSLGYKRADAAIGRQVYSQGYKNPITIIGVTKDFSFRSMRDKVGPTAISHVSGAGHFFSYFSIKIGSENLTHSIASIEKKFHLLLPDAPFEFSFADEALQQLYQSELQLKKAAQTATILAVLIVISGILGMVSLSIVQRNKELAIRKVIGASTQSIILLFMNEFLLALTIAMLIAFPVAYLLMTSWLQNFAYHIDVNWLSFLVVGLSFIIAISLVVSLQTMKAALMNPVKSLRSE